MSMMPIKFLTIHCAATPEGRDVKADTISDWDKAKFGQTSYHWVIELNGIAVHTLPDDHIGAHVALNNSHNIGICYVGGVDLHGNPKDTRTKDQKVTLKRLIEEYQNKYPGLVIRGHRDWPRVHKACPSFDVQDWIEAGMPTGDEK